MSFVTLEEVCWPYSDHWWFSDPRRSEPCCCGWNSFMVVSSMPDGPAWLTLRSSPFDMHESRRAGSELTFAALDKREIILFPLHWLAELTALNINCIILSGNLFPSHTKRQRVMWLHESALKVKRKLHYRRAFMILTIATILIALTASSKMLHAVRCRDRCTSKYHSASQN